MHTARRITTIIIATICIIGLGACGAAQTTDPDATGERLASSLSAYAQQLLDENDDTIGDTQRAAVQRVIDTGEVSRNDYETALNDYANCVADKGYSKPTFYTLPNGIKQPNVPSVPLDATLTYSDQLGNAMGDCDQTYMSIIAKLYQVQVGNPNLYANYDEGAVDCLKRAELVPKDYTIAQYRDDISTLNHLNPGETPETTLDRSDPDVQSCMVTNGHVLIGDPDDQ